MNDMFPKSRRGRKGYQPDQVEKFLETAREDFQYLGIKKIDTHAADIRAASFDLVPKGYSVAEVDQALDRLEIVFFEREYERNLTELGALKMHEQVQERIQKLRDVFERDAQERFTTTEKGQTGYFKKDVDAFLDLLQEHLDEGKVLTSDQVRNIGFRPRKKGYVDAEVDPYIDEVIEILMIEELDRKNRERGLQ